KRSRNLPGPVCFSCDSPEPDIDDQYNRATPSTWSRQSGRTDFSLDESDTSNCAQSSVDPRFRRRGYTESQINRRTTFPGSVYSESTVTATSTSSAITTAVSHGPSQPLTSASAHFQQALSLGKLGILKGKHEAVPTSLNPATYIDALIHSHLNKANRSMDDIDPPSPNPSGLTSPDVESKSGINAVSTVDRSQPTNPPVNNPNSTLEEQINKAIAEEIRAQIRSQRSAIPYSLSDNGARVNSAPVIAMNSPSTTPDCVPSSIVPIKKRDRDCSSTFDTSAPKTGAFDPVDPSKWNSFLSGLSNFSRVATYADLPDEASGVKLVPTSAVNGTKVSLDVSAKFRLDPRFRFLLPAKTSEHQVPSTKQEPPSAVHNPSSGTCPSVSENVLSTTYKPGEDNLLKAVSPASSIGDMESPGKLQIDLAASDPNQSLNAESDLIPTRSRPYSLDSSMQQLRSHSELAPQAHSPGV
ncbi:hypothetical protein AHF37_00311, partial [Paragonimus kellicotti]